MAFEDESLYAVIAIPVIFLLGLAGVAIPSIIAIIFPKYGVTRKLHFSFFNGLAGGLILAVGLIHSLPEAIDGLDTVVGDSDASDLTKGYPWAIWVALMAIVIMFAVEELLDVITHRFGIESFDGHSHGGGGHDHHHHHHHHHGAHEEHACDHTAEEHVAMDGACDAQPLEEQCTHGHSKDAVASSSDSESDLEAGGAKKEGECGGGVSSTADDSCATTKKEEEEGTVKPPAVELFMKMVVLFVGLFFHNIFVGLALGIADNDYVLFIALLCHQFFEGLGMGARVAMTKMRRAFVVVIIDLAFASTPSIFIGVGIGIKNGVASADSSSGYNGANGTLQALSAGMLIYIALLHMLRSYKDIGVTGKRLDFHRLASFLGLLLGAGIMSVIGIWA